jgi:hypothetical protein
MVSTPEPPAPPKPTRNDFRCGEKVPVEDKYLNTVVGTIVRIYQRTATITTGDGSSWRVDFSFLRHVVDIRVGAVLVKRAIGSRLRKWRRRIRRSGCG